MRWNWIFTFIYRLCYKLMLKSLKEGSSLKRESYFGQLDLITWQNFIFTSTFFLKLRLLKWTTYYIDIPWPRWENIRITIEALFLNRQFNSRLSIDNTFFADLLAVTFQHEEFNCVLLKSLTCNTEVIVTVWLTLFLIFKFSFLISGESKSFWTNDGSWSKLRGFHSSSSKMQRKWPVRYYNFARKVGGIKLKAPNMYFEITRILTFTNKTDVCWVCLFLLSLLLLFFFYPWTTPSTN